MKTGDNELIKQINYGIILDTVRELGPISRIDISRKTGLSRSTCSLICEHMLEHQVLIEKGKSESSGGRKPVLLDLNPDAGCVISLKLMEREIFGAVVNIGGEAIERQRITLRQHVSSDRYMAELTAFIERLIRSAPIREAAVGGEQICRQEILGIGIGVSGRVDSKAGVLLESSILEWKQIPIGSLLENRFHVPVFLENDVNTLAIGEKYYGMGKHYRNYLCVTVGEGIGLGIMLGGTLYRGHHHGAGEFGHMKIDTHPQAPLCSCGQRGCLEAFASDSAIERYAAEETGSILDIEDITTRAQQGDEGCREAFRTAGTYLGLGISNLINLFDPEAIIIGGERAGAAALFMEPMRKAITEHSVYELAGDIRIHALNPDMDHWVRGVATLAMKEFILTAGGRQG